MATPVRSAFFLRYRVDNADIWLGNRILSHSIKRKSEKYSEPLPQKDLYSTWRPSTVEISDLRASQTDGALQGLQRFIMRTERTQKQRILGNLALIFAQFLFME